MFPYNSQVILKILISYAFFHIFHMFHDGWRYQPPSLRPPLGLAKFAEDWGDLLIIPVARHIPASCWEYHGDKPRFFILCYGKYGDNMRNIWKIAHIDDKHYDLANLNSVIFQFAMLNNQRLNRLVLPREHEEFSGKRWFGKSDLKTVGFYSQSGWVFPADFPAKKNSLARQKKCLCLLPPNKAYFKDLRSYCHTHTHAPLKI